MQIVDAEALSNMIFQIGDKVRGKRQRWPQVWIRSQRNWFGPSGIGLICGQIAAFYHQVEHRTLALFGASVVAEEIQFIG